MRQEIHKALIEIGFVKRGKYYEKDNLSIKVYDDSKLSDVFKKLIDFGVTQKVWEFKRVMQITDSY